MIGGGTGADLVEGYLEHAVAGDSQFSVRLALNLLDRSVPFDEIIVGLLGVAQHEVGQRWLRNEWTVADEHLASGATQKALDAIANSVEAPAAGGLVVVACAEGDWHSLPAQMFAEMLRSHGFTVAFLGASTPVDHVGKLISRHHPDALAVSCNLALFFSGVTRLVDAAHRHGIPVIAGGRALGVGPDRAARLGVDAWAAGVDDAVRILHEWQRQPPAIHTEPTPINGTLLELDAMAPEIAGAAFEALTAAYPPMATYNNSQLARTKEDLAFITQFIAAARLVNDPSVLADMLDWLRTLLATRGVPSGAVAAGLTVLAPVISQVDPQAGQLALDSL